MDPPPFYFPRSPPPINPETASMHSLAPSYHSATPSYYSTLPIINPSPSITRDASTVLNSNHSLNHFRIPTWSNATGQNPTIRHYQRVAHRRTMRGVGGDDGYVDVKENVIATSGVSTNAIKGEDVFGVDEDEEAVVRRPLEDEELVGEEAAARARRERIEREKKAGDEILRAEDERWDWMINQMRDWDQREQNWQKFKTGVEGGRSGLRKGSRRVLGRFGR